MIFSQKTLTAIILDFSLILNTKISRGELIIS